MIFHQEIQLLWHRKERVIFPPFLPAQHLALAHNRLDDILNDPHAVAEKRAQLNISIDVAPEADPPAHAHSLSVTPAQYGASLGVSGPLTDLTCPICDQPYSKKELREHCARHFSEEVGAIYNAFADQTVCDICSGAYASRKKTSMFRHIALGHGKLDGFLQDAELVAHKRQIVAQFGLDRFRGQMK